MFALDTARGMAHVHSLGRMHRDLKSGNLLISSSLHVKVADFGTATIAGMAATANAEGGYHEGANKSINADSGLLDAAAIRAHTQRTKGVGTPLWMAPEVIMGKTSYGPAADVYSFAIVMWEIAAQDVPWKEVKAQSFFMDALLKEILAEKRPAIDANWPAAYSRLMQQCWATDPVRRGTFAEAVEVLEKG